MGEERKSREGEGNSKGQMMDWGARSTCYIQESNKPYKTPRTPLRNLAAFFGGSGFGLKGADKGTRLTSTRVLSKCGTWGWGATLGRQRCSDSAGGTDAVKCFSPGSYFSLANDLHGRERQGIERKLRSP